MKKIKITAIILLFFILNYIANSADSFGGLWSDTLNFAYNNKDKRINFCTTGELGTEQLEDHTLVQFISYSTSIDNKTCTQLNKKNFNIEKDIHESLQRITEKKLEQNPDNPRTKNQNDNSFISSKNVVAAGLTLIIQYGKEFHAVYSLFDEEPGKTGYFISGNTHPKRNPYKLLKAFSRRIPLFPEESLLTQSQKDIKGDYEKWLHMRNDITNKLQQDINQNTTPALFDIQERINFSTRELNKTYGSAIDSEQHLLYFLKEKKLYLRAQKGDFTSLESEHTPPEIVKELNDGTYKLIVNNGNVIKGITSSESFESLFNHSFPSFINQNISEKASSKKSVSKKTVFIDGDDPIMTDIITLIGRNQISLEDGDDSIDGKDPLIKDLILTQKHIQWENRLVNKYKELLGEYKYNQLHTLDKLFQSLPAIGGVKTTLEEAEKLIRTKKDTMEQCLNHISNLEEIRVVGSIFHLHSTNEICRCCLYSLSEDLLKKNGDLNLNKLLHQNNLPLVDFFIVLASCSKSLDSNSISTTAQASPTVGWARTGLDSKKNIKHILPNNCVNGKITIDQNFLDQYVLLQKSLQKPKSRGNETVTSEQEAKEPEQQEAKEPEQEADDCSELFN